MDEFHFVLGISIPTYWDINNVPAVERGAGMDGQKITCTLIMHRLGDLFYRLVSQKFEDPAEGETALVAKFKKLYDDLTAGFRNLEDETR
ncbi:hypothetical protein RHGRI_014382 [Rhododendron griersonianum]|uniref:Uncharacterized protein n=1 Tax=Rhododendron griersonianum TaxID=479676 RepID=A0AAV6K9N9_9ERIC|nr:hypothetical protein RHGRI_014382 [Rhododendron griersonianum]